MTTAHVDLDSNNPVGTQTPAAYATSDLANLRALRDMIIVGLVPGFVQTRTQGTGPDVQRPQFLTWNNATLNIGFRWNITWTGFNPTTVQEEWQNDGVPNWLAVGAAQVNTFDASNNITASTNSGGHVNLIFELWGKVGKVVSDFATHIAATGTAVHGLASMAIQAASAIAVTGGNIDGTVLGATTPEKADTKRVREVIDNGGAATAVANAGTYTPDLALAGYFKVQPSATLADTITIAAPSNAPSASRTQSWTLEIVNGRRSADGKITWNGAYHWVGGASARPLDTALEVAGSNLFDVCWNGTNWDISHAGKRG
jgi:hypothetical protein